MAQEFLSTAVLSPNWLIKISLKMLDVGDKAPDFVLLRDTGDSVSLDELLADGALILYFYPADFTPGCTVEACDIRDMYPDIKAANASVVGVSPQSVQTHQRFKSTFQLPFPLLADPQKIVIRSFGVNGPMDFGVRRVTFLINQAKWIADRVVADFAIKRHSRFIENVLDDLGGY